MRTLLIVITFAVLNRQQTNLFYRETRRVLRNYDKRTGGFTAQRRAVLFSLSCASRPIHCLEMQNTICVLLLLYSEHIIKYQAPQRNRSLKNFVII